MMKLKIIEVAEEKGFESGFKQGFEIGFKEGLLIGYSERNGHAADLSTDTVKNLLDSVLTKELASRCKIAYDKAMRERIALAEKVERIEQGIEQGIERGIIRSQTNIALIAFRGLKQGRALSDIVDMLKEFGIPDEIIKNAEEQAKCEAETPGNVV